MAPLKSLLTVALLCLSGNILASHVDQEHIHISPEFILTYEVQNNSIWFEIDVQATGWVALGFNMNNITEAHMPGSDFFIGGVNPDNTTYGDDYFIESDNSSIPALPQLDTSDNGTSDWTIISGHEITNETTNITRTIIQISRLLNTTDMGHDIMISNDNITLLWAYHNESDSVEDEHTHQGVHSVNLFSEPSGAPTISLAIGMLMMGLVAALIS